MERRDQLEEFVKNQLTHYEELPSPGLWGKIEGAIPLPNKARRPIWFVWVLGALVLCSGFVVWHFYYLNQWKGQLEEQAIAIQELRAKVQDLQSDLARENFANQGAPVSEGAMEPDKMSEVSRAAHEEKERLRSLSSQEVETAGVQPVDKLLDAKPSSKLLLDSFVNSPSLQVISPSSPSLATKVEDSLPTLEPYVVASAAEKNHGNLEALAVRPLRSRRWSVGVWSEGTNFHENPFKALWNQRRRSEEAGGNIPSFYANNPSTTKTLGLFVDFDLSRRWSVRTGIGYKEQRRPLGGDFVFAYTLDNSQMNALGHSVSPYSYYDESHKIGISTIIANALSNEPNGLEPGELFEMDFSAYQKTNYISIPLWLTYQMGDGRLKYHLRTGLVWNDLISNSSKIRYLSFSFSQLYYQGHAISDGTIQVGYLDAGLGYGLEYGMNPRLNLYLDGVMYKSITPIFDRQPFSLGLSGGLRYQL